MGRPARVGLGLNSQPKNQTHSHGHHHTREGPPHHKPLLGTPQSPTKAPCTCCVRIHVAHHHSRSTNTRQEDTNHFRIGWVHRGSTSPQPARVARAETKAIPVDEWEGAEPRCTLKSTTSFLTATMLVYALGAGITAAAGTRLALQLILIAGFG